MAEKLLAKIYAWVLIEKKSLVFDLHNIRNIYIYIPISHNIKMMNRWSKWHIGDHLTVQSSDGKTMDPGIHGCHLRCTTNPKDFFMTHYKNCTGMIWAKGIDLASKFPGSHSNHASVRCAETNPYNGRPTSQLTGLKHSTTKVPDTTGHLQWATPWEAGAKCDPQWSRRQLDLFQREHPWDVLEQVRYKYVCVTFMRVQPNRHKTSLATTKRGISKMQLE